MRWTEMQSQLCDQTYWARNQSSDTFYKNILKFSSIFLRISISSIEAEVAGKRLNRGGDYGLEIPVKYRFYDQGKIYQWLTKILETVKELECKFLNV